MLFGPAQSAFALPEWSAGYPPDKVDSQPLPQAWTDALAAAVKAGKIPDFPPSQNVPGQNPVYPNGLDPNGDVVCSATEKCRNSGDIWDAPDGVFASSFDDGPTEVRSYSWIYRPGRVLTDASVRSSLLRCTTS